MHFRPDTIPSLDNQMCMKFYVAPLPHAEARLACHGGWLASSEDFYRDRAKHHFYVRYANHWTRHFDANSQYWSGWVRLPDQTTQAGKYKAEIEFGVFNGIWAGNHETHMCKGQYFWPTGNFWNPPNIMCSWGSGTMQKGYLPNVQTTDYMNKHCVSAGKFPENWHYLRACSDRLPRLCRRTWDRMPCAAVTDDLGEETVVGQACPLTLSCSILHIKAEQLKDMEFTYTWKVKKDAKAGWDVFQDVQGKVLNLPKAGDYSGAKIICSFSTSFTRPDDGEVSPADSEASPPYVVTTMDMPNRPTIKMQSVG